MTHKAHHSFRKENNKSRAKKEIETEKRKHCLTLLRVRVLPQTRDNKCQIPQRRTKQIVISSCLSRQWATMLSFEVDVFF